MVTIETRYGQLEAFPPSEDFISQYLSLYGEWAFLEARMVSELMPGAVLDIGAFLGTFGLGLNSLVPLTKLVFVEANGETAKRLRTNVARIGPEHAVVVEAAVVGDKDGVSASAPRDNKGAYSLVLSPSDSREAHIFKGDCVSLSDLFAQYGPFDLVKLDIEGAELPALKAEEAWLRAQSVRFWIEANERPDVLDICTLLLHCGFDVYLNSFPVFSPDNHTHNSATALPFAHEAALLAVKGDCPPLSRQLTDLGCRRRRVTSAEELRVQLWRTPRWAPLEWRGLSRVELIATAAHMHLGHDYGQFLQPGVELSEISPYERLNFTRARVKELEAANEFLSRDIAISAARAANLEESVRAKAELAADSHRRLSAAQARIAEIEQGMLGVQDQLRHVQDQLRQATEEFARRADEAGRQHQEAISRERAQWVAAQTALFRSTSWRITAPLRGIRHILLGRWDLVADGLARRSHRLSFGRKRKA